MSVFYRFSCLNDGPFFGSLGRCEKTRGKNWVFKLGDQGLGYYEAEAKRPGDLRKQPGDLRKWLFSWI